MITSESQQNEFNYLTFHFDFKKNETTLGQFLDSLNKAANSLDSYGGLVLGTLGLDLRQELTIHHVRPGSIVIALAEKIWPKKNGQELTEEDEDVFRSYLHRAYMRLMKFIAGRNKILDKKELEELIENTYQDAPSGEFIPTKMRAPDVANRLKAFSNAAEAISSAGELTIGIAGGEYILNKNFRFTDNDFERIVFEKTKTYQMDATVKIKMIDFIGKSKWEFRLNGDKLYCKIADEAWLDDFHSGKKVLLPHDGLKVKMSVTRYTDQKGNVLKEVHVIDEVMDIVALPHDDQIDLLEDDDE